MFRYCSNCQKEYDFKIGSVKDLENLVCPQCGNPIDKNSKRPINNSQSQQMEDTIEKAYFRSIRFAFVMLLLCEIVGLIAFLLKWNVVLYVATAIGLVLYAFIYGLINVMISVVGGVLGFLLFHSFAGVCLGMLVVMFIRRVFTRILWKLLSILVGWSKGSGD